MIGFVNLGNVDDCLNLLQRGNGELPERLLLATYMLVYMIRGIVTTLSFPYAHFPTTEVTSLYRFDLVWEAVRNIELTGLKVLKITCNGAAANRKFFRMHAEMSADAVVYNTENPYNEEGRPISFLSDPPHLSKTTRNCCSHFTVGSVRRGMWVGNNTSGFHPDKWKCYCNMCVLVGYVFMCMCDV